jgi:carboxypeptidase family protein
VLRYAIRLSVMIIILGMSAGFVTAVGYAQEDLFAVKGFVVDPSGAVIPQAEVVFKGESDRIAAHTGMDGSVNVNLAAGKYGVTISAVGFATTKLVDFSVPRAAADAFRITLKVDQSPTYHGWGPGPDNIAVPTVPSELPDTIQDEPTCSSLPVAQPATTKRPSMGCLYLWRCSVSQP